MIRSLSDPLIHALVSDHGAARIIDLLSPLVLPGRLATLQRVVKRRRLDVTLLLSELHDTHNYSAIIRSAEALGLHTVHALGEEGRFAVNSEISKSVEKWIHFVTHPVSAKACAQLKAQGYQLLGADAGGESLRHVKPTGRICLVMGEEKHGLSPEIRAQCDGLVGIEMSGFVESFNVSVAAALLMQEALTHTPAEYLSPQASEALLAEYLIQSVQSADAILKKRLSLAG